MHIVTRRMLETLFLYAALGAEVVAQPLQVYTHPTEGVQISVPSSWRPNTSDPEVLVEFETPEDTSFYLSIVYEPIPFQIPTGANYNLAMTNFFREFRKGVAEELQISPEKVVELGRRVHQAGDLKVSTLDTRFTHRDDWAFRARLRFVFADNRLYVITLSADEEEFTQNETLVNQILDSFQPKNPQQSPFSARVVVIALGAVCVSVVLMTGLIWFLVRKFWR